MNNNLSRLFDVYGPSNLEEPGESQTPEAERDIAWALSLITAFPFVDEWLWSKGMKADSVPRHDYQGIREQILAEKQQGVEHVLAPLRHQYGYIPRGSR